MDTKSAEIDQLAEKLLEDSSLEKLAAEVGVGVVRSPGRAPAVLENSNGWSTACRSGKLNYSHAAMLDLIIGSPGISQGELAIRFGYTEGWVSNVLASDAFQAQLAARREAIVDPVLKATVEEHIRALTLRSLFVLQRKLDQPQVSDTVALKAFELGAKAMGLGGNAAPKPEAPNPPRLEELAQRLVELQNNVRRGVTYEGDAAVVT